MAIIDGDSPGLYLLMVLLVSCCVLIGKFMYYNLEFFYSIKRMIFTVVRAVADEGYGQGAYTLVQNNDGCNCAGLPSTETVIDPLGDEITKDFDSYIVNLSKYLENNKDANRRLDVLNQESSRYIDFNNYLEVIKFFILIALVIGAIVIIIKLKYRRWLSPFDIVTTKSA